RGIPYYSYNETWRDGGTGWKSYQMTNWFMPNFVNGNTKGLVLYNTGGEYGKANGIGVSNYVRFRVTGEWEPEAEASTPRLSTSRQNLGSYIDIYTDRNKAGLTHTIKYELGNASGTIATGIGTNTRWTLPNDLA